MRSSLGHPPVWRPLLVALVLWSPRLLEDLTGYTTARHVIASGVLQRALLIDTAIYLVFVTSIALIAGVLSPSLAARWRGDASAGGTRALACASVLAASSAVLVLHAVLAPLLTGAVASRLTGLTGGGIWGIPTLAGIVVLGAVLGYPLAALLRLGIERARGRKADGLWYAVLLLLWVATTHPQAQRLPGQILLVGSSLVAVWLLLPVSQVGPRARRAGVLAASVAVPALVLVTAAWVGPSHAFALRAAKWMGRIPPATETPAASSANVLLIVVDTWRADRTIPGGYPKATTPRLAAALDERTTWFHRAHAAAPATRLSVEALITSRLPSHWAESQWSVPKLRAWTMAEAFRSSGYQTAAFSANAIISLMVYRKGFETFWAAGGGGFCLSSFFIDHILSGGKRIETLRRIDDWGLHKVSGETIRALGREWLRDRDRERPFFLYLHVVEPHWPYRDYGHGLIEDAVRVDDPLSYVDLLEEVSPEKEPTAAITRGLPEMLARYDESIREADDFVGGMLDDLESLGLSDSTLVVMLGDHGDEFLEHGGFSHGHDVFQELIHVPLVIRWPRSPGFHGYPTRITEPVSLLDVFPTLEDYLSLTRAPQPHAGSSLRRLLEGKRTARDAPVIAQAITGKIWRTTYIDGDLKVRLSFDSSSSPLQSDDIQVFDLGIDAAERTPLTLADSAVAEVVERAREALHQRWLAWPDRNQDLAPAEAGQSTQDKVIEQLRALGYVE